MGDAPESEDVEGFNSSSLHYEYFNVCNEFAAHLNISFPLVVVFGTSIASVSVLQNSFLFFLFLTRRSLRESNLYYMIFLALLDIFVATSYVAVMGVQILAEYTESARVSGVWHSYVRPVFTLSHVALTSSSFLIIAATSERFLTSFNIVSPHIPTKNRLSASLGALGLGFLTKGTIYFEYATVTHMECDNHNRYRMDMTWLSLNDLYRTVWMFWIRNITTTLLPFFLLASLNLAILLGVRKARQKTVQNLLLSMGTAGRKRLEEKANVRAATRMLVLVVLTYLLTNFLSVLLTVWEHINAGSLLEYDLFYSISIQLTSVLTVCGGAVRLEIFCWCNKQIRKESKQVLSGLGRCLGLRLSDGTPVIRWSARSQISRTEMKEVERLDSHASVHHSPCSYLIGRKPAFI